MSSLADGLKTVLTTIEHVADEVLNKVAPFSADAARYAETIKAHVATGHELLDQDAARYAETIKAHVATGHELLDQAAAEPAPAPPVSTADTGASNPSVPFTG